MVRGTVETLYLKVMKTLDINYMKTPHIFILEHENSYIEFGWILP